MAGASSHRCDGENPVDLVMSGSSFHQELPETSPRPTTSVCLTTQGVLFLTLHLCLWRGQLLEWPNQAASFYGVDAVTIEKEGDALPYNIHMALQPTRAQVEAEVAVRYVMLRERLRSRGV